MTIRPFGRSWQIDFWPDVHFYPRSVEQLYALASPTTYQILLLEWPYQYKNWLETNPLDPWMGETHLHASAQKELAMRYGTTNYQTELLKRFDGQVLCIDDAKLRSQLIEQTGVGSLEGTYFKREISMVDCVRNFITTAAVPGRALLVGGVLHMPALMKLLNRHATVRCLRNFEEVKEDFVSMAEDLFTTKALGATFDPNIVSLYKGTNDFWELRAIEIGLGLAQCGVSLSSVDQTLLLLHQRYGLS